MSKGRYGEPPRGTVTPMSDADRILGQIRRGEVIAGPEGAREIAARLEGRGYGIDGGKPWRDDAKTAAYWNRWIAENCPAAQEVEP